MTRLAIVAALMAPLTTATAAQAADAPAEIKLGTLYASSGRFASISMPVHDGLKLWIDQKNADGGVYVKAFDKKIPLKLVAYDDQSSTATAATLYNQLITQDKVDILIADSGSVLTSVAVPIARDHKMLLIDQTGTGANFFTSDNPYIALMADPVSSVWPKPLADFLTHDGPGLGIKRVAMLYATNDFTGTQATTIRKLIRSPIPESSWYSTRACPLRRRTTRCCSTTFERQVRTPSCISDTPRTILRSCATSRTTVSSLSSCFPSTRD